MPHRIDVVVDGKSLGVDGRDVATWAQARAGVAGDDRDWVLRASEYVDEHPRAAARTADSQRLAILRRLAAGPATRAELLAAMRTAGWVGHQDLENRLRDLRGTDTRGGARAGRIDVHCEGERYWLTEPFALLDDADRRALGFAKAMLERLDGPMPVDATAVLDRLLPGLAASGRRTAARYRASAGDFQRFDAALRARRPVRVRYFSLNSGQERTYELVPVEYVALGATVKAVCVEVDAFGRRVGEDGRQFALDRLLAVEELPDWPTPRRSQLALPRSDIVLEVTDALYQVMRQRNLFAIADETAEEVDLGVWRVRGSFPTALAWDVMEQLCAWAGNAQVHRPFWLVNAVVRRLRAGLRVMEEGAAFELVKPDASTPFASHRDAVAAEPPPEGTGARKLAPRRR
jgi:hypothetical protein